MKLKALQHLLVFAIFSTNALADEPVDTIRTSGRAELEKVSDFLLFSSSKKFPIQVPSQVSAGDSFDIQYTADGKLTQVRFTVVDMAIRGDLCWLHSKKRSQGDLSLGDTIYVKPCARVR
ncbi:MAG: hypothetical protein WBO95_10530 [Candidatus Dechloromonas phosphoritropha]|jgi:hypothetical protein